MENQVRLKKDSLPGKTEEGGKKELLAHRASKGKTTRKKGFVMVPRSILNNPQLTLRDKWLWIVLASCRNNRIGLCDPTIAKMCTLSTLNKKTILKSRRKLREMNLISYGPIKGKGHRTQYKLHWFESGSIGVKSDSIGVKNTPKHWGKKYPNTPQEKSLETGKDKALPETQEEKNNKNITIRNNNNREEDLPDDEGKYPNLKNLKPKTLEALRGLSLSIDTIDTLIDKTQTEDVNELFLDYIFYIKKRGNIKNPGGYFIDMVEKKVKIPEMIHEKRLKANLRGTFFPGKEVDGSTQEKEKIWKQEMATPQQEKAHMDRIRKMLEEK